MTINQQVFLKSRPARIPQAEHFDIRDGVIPEIGEGEFLVRNHFLSADPAMRGWICDRSNYSPQIQLGETMRALAVGDVIESKNAEYARGDLLMGIFGWQEYSAASGKNVILRVSDRTLPLSAYLGGVISDAVIQNIAPGARIVICGTAAYPSWNPWNLGPRPERHLLVKRARMQGFLTMDYADRFADALKDLVGWIHAGKIRYREEVLDGLAHAPGSLERLYSGENMGKLVMRLPAAYA